MGKNSSLEEILDALLEIRAFTRDKATNIAEKRLDDLIKLVRQRIKGGNGNDEGGNGNDGGDANRNTLELLGKLLEKLPRIAALIKHLLD